MVSYALCKADRDSSGNLADNDLMNGMRGLGTSMADSCQKDGAELAKTVLAAAVSLSSASETSR